MPLWRQACVESPRYSTPTCSGEMSPRLTYKSKQKIVFFTRLYKTIRNSIDHMKNSRDQEGHTAPAHSSRF